MRVIMRGYGDASRMCSMPQLTTGLVLTLPAESWGRIET